MLLSAAITFVVGILCLTVFLIATDKPNNNGGTGQTETAMVSIDSYVGRNFYEVENFPNIKKLRVTKNYAYSDEYGKGIIVVQSLAPGEYAAGTEIVFTISDGVEMITLPDNLIGMTYEEAEKRLTEIGFVCKKLEIHSGYDNSNAEKVVAIGLQANKDYAKGTEITLRVFIPEGNPVTDIFGEKVTDANGNFIYEVPTTEAETTDEYPVPEFPSSEETF